MVRKGKAPARPRVRTVDLETCTARHVTIHDVATYWGVSITTIRRDIRKGALVSKRVGSSRLIRVPIAAARAYGA